MNYETINKQIDTLKASEKVTKKVLGELSRSTLEYYMIDKDIRPINRLLQVNTLSPVNRKVASVFFHSMLACCASNWEEHKESNVALKLGKANKSKVKATFKKLSTFLEEKSNNIWTWQATNVKVEKKEVDYLKRIDNAFEQAEKHEVSKLDMMKVIMKHINAEDLNKLAEDALEVVEDEPAF